VSSATGARPAGLGAFVQLGKLGIVEPWLGFFVAVSLLGGAAVASARSLCILALTLASTIAAFALTCCLDDISGARDGVDQANHRGGARWGVSKPILEGRLSERRALGYARLLGALTALGYLGVVALAWPLPGWVVVATAAVVLLAASYSYGPKLSYRGAGEPVIFAATAGTVLIPYLLVARVPSWTAVIDAVLVGSWNVQVMIFSNTQDAAGDRAAGRRTIAARLSERGNRLYIACLFIFWGAVTLVALVAGLAPSGYVPALVVVWALQVFQLWTGLVKGRCLQARRWGFRVVRAGTAALVIANLLTLHRS
jgi:1,4-dihydroxy-2-naphthoate octaprenyltransferase